MQATTGEQPVVDDDAIHAVPDVELLQFQKQRSTPKVSLSSVNLDGEEENIVEIDDFANVDQNAGSIGMAPAGTEDFVVRELKRAGSLKMSEGAAQQNNEEMKE